MERRNKNMLSISGLCNWLPKDCSGIRRLFSYIINGVAILSLLLCFTLVMLWLRTWWRTETVGVGYGDGITGAWIVFGSADRMVFGVNKEEYEGIRKGIFFIVEAPEP